MKTIRFTTFVRACRAALWLGAFCLAIGTASTVRVDAQESQAADSAQTAADASANGTSNADAPSSDEPQPDPNALAAIDLFVGGDVEGAFQLFKKVYDANQDSDPPGVLLALLHSHAGQFLEMRRALEQSAEDYPTDPAAFIKLANVDIQEGRFLEAELLLERAERLTEEYPKIRPESTTCLTYLKVEALNSRANLAERRERYELARSFVLKSIDLNPDDPQSYWNLGYLSMKLNDFDAASRGFDEAAKRNTELWPGWLQVASSLDREDRVDEGRAWIGKHADDVAAAERGQRAQLARLYLRWNMLDEARAIVDAFAEENLDRDVERWLLNGWLALYASKYAVAEESFRNATLVDENNFEASNGLALALLDQGNKEKLARARAIAAKNYRAHADSAEAAATYAWTLFLSGNTKESDALFQPILNSGKMSATVAYYLAEIANVRGDKSLTRNLLKLATSQKSNFPKRAAALELLKLLDEEDEAPVDPMSDFDEEPDFGEENAEEATSEDAANVETESNDAEK